DYTNLLTTSDCNGPVALIQTPAAGTTLNGLGALTVTITAKDAANNASTCTFTVEVADTAPPHVTECQADITVPTDPSQSSAQVSWAGPTISDNCGGTVAFEANGVFITSPAVFPLGATTVTCTATDGAGNSATCSFTVTVLQRLRVLFRASLSDPPVSIKFNAGQTVQHKG